jgi:uncharacterized protein YqeY
MAETTLKQQLQEAMKAAMRAHEKQRLAVVRAMLAQFKQVEVDERIEVDDARALIILDKMLKQRRESISQYQAAKRDDLAQQEQYELDIIQSFMPPPLSEAEIQALIEQAFIACNATSIKEMGQLMAWLKPKLQGRADTTQVGNKIKAHLATLS